MREKVVTKIIKKWLYKYDFSINMTLNCYPHQHSRGSGCHFPPAGYELLLASSIVPPLIHLGWSSDIDLEYGRCSSSISQVQFSLMPI